MVQWMNKNRGSISIFLVIILIPMLSVAGVLVDGGRMKLAEGMVAGAGDLVMDSALADYDTVLKEVYGLMAVSQSDEELQENLYQYFVHTLMAGDIISSEEELKGNPLLQDLAAGFSGKPTTELFQFTVEKENFQLTKVPGSSLAEPKLLKNQIVEFMKYRAPLDGVTAVLEGFGMFQKASKQTKTLKYQAKVGEAVEDFQKKGKSLYDTLQEYIKRVEGEKPQVSGLLPYVLEYETIFETVSLYPFEEVPALPKRIRKQYEKQKETVRGTEEAEAGAAEGMGSNTSFQEWKKGCEQQTEFLKTFSEQPATKNVQQAEKLFLYLDSSVPELDMLEQAYQELSKEEKSTGREVWEKLCMAAGEAREIACGYEAALKKAAKNSGSSAMIIKQAAKQNIKWIKDTLDLLKNARKGIRYSIEKDLDNIEKNNQRLKDSVNEYSVSEGEDEFSGNMKSEAAYTDKVFQKEKTLQELEKIDQVLEEQETYWTEVQETYESLRYAGTSITDIDSFQKLRDIHKNWKEENRSIVDQMKEALKNNEVEKTWRHLWGVPLYTGKPFPAEIDLELSFEENDFWNYLKRTFTIEQKIEAKEEKEQKDTLIESSSKEAEAIKEEALKLSSGIENIHETYPALPSTLPAGGEDTLELGIDSEAMKQNKGFSSMLDNMSNVLGGLVSQIGDMLETGRDNLFVMDYAFQMFSCYTSEAELQERNKDAEPPQLCTITDIPISKVNNPLYQAEIEYLIYGREQPEKNVSLAKSYIFAVRFGLNAGYAITSRDLSNETLPPAVALQTATMGVVPYKLTQMILKLSLALAETVWDMKELEEGKAVVLIKGKDTWRMSLHGAVNLLKEEVAEGIQSATSQLSGYVGDWLDEQAGGVKQLSSEATETISDTASSMAENVLGQLCETISNAVIAQLSSMEIESSTKPADVLAEQILSEAENAAKDYISRCSSGQLQVFLNQKVDGLLGEVRAQKQEITEMIKKIQDGSLMMEKILELKQTLSGRFMGMIDGYLQEFQGWVEQEVDKLNGKVKNCAQEKITEGADAINEAVQEEIDSFFGDTLGIKGEGGVEKTGEGSGLLSLLKFHYSDYLRLFFLAKISFEEEAVLKRTGDLIQINVASGFCDASGAALFTHGKGKEFRLSDAFTYVELNAEVEMNTLFLFLPYQHGLTGKNRSSIPLHYKGALGY